MSDSVMPEMPQVLRDYLDMTEGRQAEWRADLGGWLVTNPSHLPNYWRVVSSVRLATLDSFYQLVESHAWNFTPPPPAPVAPKPQEQAEVCVMNAKNPQDFADKLAAGGLQIRPVTLEEQAEGFTYRTWTTCAHHGKREERADFRGHGGLEGESYFAHELNIKAMHTAMVAVKRMLREYPVCQYGGTLRLEFKRVGARQITGYEVEPRFHATWHCSHCSKEGGE